MIQKIVHIIREEPFNIALILAFVIALFILIKLYFNTDESGDWEKFRIENNCIQKFPGNSKRAIWQCDEDKVFYRWRQQR